MKFRSSFSIITLLFVHLFAGCRYLQDYVEFMKLPEEKRKEIFEKFPLEKQVDFYLIRAINSHPSDISLAENIAQGGEKVIPYLIERLRSEKKDYNKRFLIEIFEEIHFRVLDLRKRQDIIKPIEESIEQITNPGQKEMTQSSLEFIKTHIPKYAPDYVPKRILHEPLPQPSSPPIFQ